jgi:LytS/YehU family sensor histidine kinase
MAGVSAKLLKRWWLKQKEKERLEKEKINAELQLLKAQIHPDFMFNSLDNIYAFAQNDAAKASALLLKLSELLSYMLYECDDPFVPLEKEIKMIKDYMALKKIGMEQRLEFDMAIKGEAAGKTIAPLLLLPFIESIFSHCHEEKLENFWINLDFQITENDFSMKLINGTSAEDMSLPKGNENGLDNVQRRLEIVYPNRYELKTTTSAEMMMTLLKIQWNEDEEVRSKMLLTKESTHSDTVYTYATT